MLRDPSLIPLSHQHHNGLALCVMVRRSLAADGSPENVVKQAKRAIDRYELELVNHFEIEEQVLFPACGAMPLIDELLGDHRAIESFVGQLRETPSAPLLERFCALLPRTSGARRRNSLSRCSATWRATCWTAWAPRSIAVPCASVFDPAQGITRSTGWRPFWRDPAGLRYSRR